MGKCAKTLNGGYWYAKRCKKVLELSPSSGFYKTNPKGSTFLERIFYEKEFSRRVERRNEAQAMFDAAGRVARPYTERTSKTQDCMIAEDIWAVIRHELYKEKHGERENVMDVRSYAPILISGEKPVILNRNNKE